jgi:hypothetical protein
VQWSTDGNSWTNVGVTLAPAGKENTFTFQLSGAVYLKSFTGAGGDLTFGGTGAAAAGFIGPSDLHVQGNLLTKGGKLTIFDVQGLDVESTADNPITVSTQNLDSQNHSQGSSGDISVSVANTDPLNPILYINFTDPHITLGPSASILAQVTSPPAGTHYSAGNVTLDVTNINYSIETLLFDLFPSMQRKASIDVGDKAPIQGNNVALNAHAGDENPLVEVFSAIGLSKGAPNTITGQMDSFINGVNPLNLPLSIVYKDAQAKVTVGQSAVISAAGAVDLESNADAIALANAQFKANTRLELSFAFGWAQSDAETEVMPGAQITAGDDVTVTSWANSEAQSKASSEQKKGETISNAVQVGASVGITHVTSHTTVDAGATITSGANVNVQAEGRNNNKTSAGTKANVDGSVGLTFAVGDDNTDVKAEVDGNLNAADAPAGALQSINPFTQVDWGKTNSIISFTSPPNFRTGEEIVYSSGQGGPIPGLTNDTMYYVINVPNHANQIQLAATRQDAFNGTAITFGPYPYLSGTVNGASVNLPIT